MNYIYTVDDLSEKSGYSAGTIQDFTSLGILPKPKQWLEASVGKKGLYPEEAVSLLQTYRNFMSQGHGKTWATTQMKKLVAKLLEDENV